MVRNSVVNKNKSLIKFIPIILFILGLTITLFINLFSLWVNLEGMSFWGYPESLSFDSSLSTNARLTSLECPTVLAPWETGKIQVTIKNPKDEPINAWVSAHISMPERREGIYRKTRTVRLEPKEKTTLTWNIGKDNIFNEKEIIARVFLRLTKHHPPARTKHCGIIIIDLWGLSGKAITALFLITGHAFQLAGVLLLRQVVSENKKKEQMILNVIIGLCFLSGLMTYGSLFHSWVFSLFSLLVSLLVIFTCIGYTFGAFEKLNS